MLLNEEFFNAQTRHIGPFLEWRQVVGGRGRCDACHFRKNNTIPVYCAEDSAEKCPRVPFSGAAAAIRLGSYFCMADTCQRRKNSFYKVETALFHSSPAAT